MATAAAGTPNTPQPVSPVALVAASQEERLKRKTSLEAELETVRTQKAEVLRAIQQIAKKQKLDGSLGAPTQTTVEAKIEAENRYHSEAKRRIWQHCGRIMSELLKNKTTLLYFGEPVRGDLYQGYYETIKKPRDLGTIKKQLESQTHFKNVYEFRDDVRLCFENCRSFNPPGNHVRNHGDAASTSFEKKWATKRVEEEWEGEMKRHELAMKRLEAEAKSLPDKIKDVDEELQALATKAAERNAPKPPGPDRAMTFEEKRKLSHSITQYVTGDQMGRILELIMASPSAPKSEGEEEIEVDIDSLDNDTLWKIQAYVDTIAAEAATKEPPRPAAQQTMTATGETPTVDETNQERTGEAHAEGGGSGSEGGGAGRAQDLTTFVSATGPGTQPQILKSSTQKKDVQIQDAKGWADLSKGANNTDKAEDKEKPAEENDTLWTEFKGREEEQKQLNEQKKALKEEEEKKKQEALLAAQKREEEEKLKAARLAEEKRKEEEELRKREADELEKMNTQAEEDAELDMMRQAGHGATNDHLDELGLTARAENDAHSEEEAMDI